MINRQFRRTHIESSLDVVSALMLACLLFLQLLISGKMQSQGFIPTPPKHLQYDSVRPNMTRWQPLHQGYGHMMQAFDTAVFRRNPDILQWQQQHNTPSLINVYNPVGSITQPQNATNMHEHHWLSCVVNFTKEQASTFLKRAKNLSIASAPRHCSQLNQEIVQEV